MSHGSSTNFKTENHFPRAFLFNAFFFISNLFFKQSMKLKKRFCGQLAFVLSSCGGWYCRAAMLLTNAPPFYYVVSNFRPYYALLKWEKEVWILLLWPLDKSALRGKNPWNKSSIHLAETFFVESVNLINPLSFFLIHSYWSVFSEIHNAVCCNMNLAWFCR